MIINRQHFEVNELKFRSIQKETFKFIDFFEDYMKKHMDRQYKFEDFMVTLANHLKYSGYSIRKIEKWYKAINNNSQHLAKEILLKKYEKI